MEMLNFKLSVVVCTYNPKEEYFIRTLEAIKNQTLDKNDWELIIVDNASDVPLSTRFGLSWQPNGRHVREERLGVVHARLKGISEAKGEVIVFVDDDNLLAANYLEVALEIGERYDFIGAWGGSIVAEFEQTPPEWTKPYWESIAIRERHVDLWSNVSESWSTTPIGAGLCVRRAVAEGYFEAAMNSTTALSLDRVGKKGLGGGGDDDIVEASLKLGLGKGVFKDLVLTHLIPAWRLELEYLLRLCEQGTKTTTLLQLKNHGTAPLPETGWKYYLRQILYIVRRDNLGMQFYRARNRGIQSARKTSP